MRYLSWIITVPIVVLAVSFTLSNRTSTPIGLWPFTGEIGIPVFLAVLLPLVAGFLLGGLVAWASGSRDRRAASRHARRAEQLSGELARLRAERAETDRQARQAAESARVEAAGRAARTTALLDRPRDDGAGPQRALPGTATPGRRTG